MITVYSVGTKCLVGGDIPAYVTAVRLNGTAVDYQVAWWDGACRRDEYLDTFEITFDGEPTQQIGFHA